MGYHHLNISNRFSIQSYLKIGYGVRSIANIMNCSPSTISREISRNGGAKEYSAVKADRNGKERRKKCHKTIRLNPDIKDYIESKIKRNWSPEEIVNRIEPDKPPDMPAVTTIYDWIHKGYIVKGGMKKLRRKGSYRRKMTSDRGTFEIGKTIRRRPNSANNRAEFGHWEADTVESCKGSKTCIVTLIDRKDRFYLCRKASDKTAASVTNSILEMLQGLPSGMVKTITMDRGTEFANWRTIEKALDCKVYFCDAYCAWQKGSNENANGLLREYFPKGTDFATVTNLRILRAQNRLNHRPRKCLNYKTPHELFMAELNNANVALG